MSCSASGSRAAHSRNFQSTKVSRGRRHTGATPSWVQHCPHFSTAMTLQPYSHNAFFNTQQCAAVTLGQANVRRHAHTQKHHYHTSQQYPGQLPRPSQPFRCVCPANKHHRHTPGMSISAPDPLALTHSHNANTTTTLVSWQPVRPTSCQVCVHVMQCNAWHSSLNRPPPLHTLLLTWLMQTQQSTPTNPDSSDRHKTVSQSCFFNGGQFTASMCHRSNAQNASKKC